MVTSPELKSAGISGWRRYSRVTSRSFLFLLLLGAMMLLLQPNSQSVSANTGDLARCGVTAPAQANTGTTWLAKLSAMESRIVANLTVTRAPSSPTKLKAGQAMTMVAAEGTTMECSGWQCSGSMYCPDSGAHINPNGTCCATCCWDDDPTNCSGFSCCNAAQ
jgi:hypothetical protein